MRSLRTRCGRNHRRTIRSADPARACHGGPGLADMSPAGPEAHIDELWMRMRPLAASRVEVLDRTLAAVVAGHYDEQVIADGPPRRLPDG